MADEPPPEEVPEGEAPAVVVDEEMAKWLIYGISIAVFAVFVPILSKFPRSRGRNIVYHISFVAVAIASITIVPESIQGVIFSPGGVLLVGTMIPVYESIVAVCTFGEADDVEWLQFWVVNASLTYSTEFMDTIAENVPFVAEHWYELEFFLTAWFLLPWTDGSTLVYDYFTVPYIAPVFTRVRKSMDGKIEAVLAMVNSGYLWIIWSTFLTLPEEARRFVVIAVGTVYPIVASTASLAIKSDETTFWLTYWSCFSLLFVLMDYLENFVGSIRGFYSLCLCATVYLFLPMFQGANVVFRRILVPLSGQYENMLLRDTLLVRREMEKNIPTPLHKNVMRKAADVFLVEKIQ